MTNSKTQMTNESINDKSLNYLGLNYSFGFWNLDFGFKLLIVGIFSAFFYLTSNLYAATPNFTGPGHINIEKANKALRVGEKFTYRVLWNGIPIGEGAMEIKDIVTFNGRQAYNIIATAKSNDFLSKLYKVEDVIRSYVDTTELCTLRFEKHQREGRYKADEVTVFDQERHTGHYESLLNKSKKDFKIPPKVQDLVSVFYYFRTLDVKPDSKLILDVNADEKNWKAVMNILDTQQLEMLRKGVYKVFCVEPKTPFKGVIAGRGRVQVYFTVDEKRVPVLIKIRVPFGFVTGILEKTE